MRLEEFCQRTQHSIPTFECNHSPAQCNISHPASIVLWRAVCAFERSRTIKQPQPRAVQCKRPSFYCTLAGPRRILTQLRRDVTTAPRNAIEATQLMLRRAGLCALQTAAFIGPIYRCCELSKEALWSFRLSLLCFSPCPRCGTTRTGF